MLRVTLPACAAALALGAGAAGCGAGDRPDGVAADAPMQPPAHLAFDGPAPGTPNAFTAKAKAAAKPVDLVHPLLGAPKTGGAPTRGMFLSDPQEQVATLAATGHLVAWSVESPAFPFGDETVPGGSLPKPATAATTSKVVVVDERGGEPLVIDLGHRRVKGMRALRGARGPAQPQLAVRSCGSSGARRCRIDLYTLTPADPVATTARTSGTRAAAAYRGVVDRGRQLIVTPHPGGHDCRPQASLRTLATGAERRLQPLPADDERGVRCNGYVDSFLIGRYAFVTIETELVKYGFVAAGAYAIDTQAGPTARWHVVQTPYNYSDGSSGDEIGPGVSGDHTLYWESNDEDGPRYSLERVLLPGSLKTTPTGDATLTTGDPVAPGTYNACDVAATDDAVYELANYACADDPRGGYPGPGYPGGIRRVVNPEFELPEQPMP